MGKLSTNLVIMRLGRGAGIGFSILFLLALVCPCCGEETQAMELPAPTENKLSVALSSQVDLNLTPEPAGSVQTGEISLRVSSGFKDGYTVYLGSSETSLTRTDKKAEIKATSSPATADRLPMNTWGYSFGRADANPNPTFSGLAGGETKLVETEVASSDDYTFDLATRVDTSLPAGTYSQDLTVSVVVNPLKPTTLTDITYMQDMTSTYCQNTALMQSNPKVVSTSDPDFNDYSQPVTKQLIDIRDKKKYWVARLADGNCWMTQNLALDINAEKGLTSADTDLNGTPNGTGDETGLVVWRKGNTGTNEDGSTKPAPSSGTNYGEYALALPQLTKSCSELCSGWYCNPSNCAGVGFVNVNKDAGYTQGYTPTIGSWGGYNNQLITVDQANKTYDSHYLIGNYYSWMTATAGSGSGTISGELRDSICAKGWKLAKPGSTDNGSYGYMLSNYGVAGPVAGTGTDGKSYNIAAPPLSFVRSGSIDQQGFSSAGLYGYLWLNISSSAQIAPIFLFINSVNPSFGTYKNNYSFPVRCLAR